LLLCTSPPPSTSTSRDSITSLLPRNEDEEGSRELVSDPGKSRADDISSKRRNVSAPQGCKIVSRNNLSQPSPPLSEDDEVQENGVLKDDEPRYRDSYSAIDPDEGDYARVLQLINEFLPVKEMAGRLIGANFSLSWACHFTTAGVNDFRHFDHGRSCPFLSTYWILKIQGGSA